MVEGNNTSGNNGGMNDKALLMERTVEYLLSNQNLSKEELNKFCEWLSKEGATELRDSVVERYYAKHPLSEENLTPIEADVERGWAEIAAKLDINPNIAYYLAILAEREAAKQSQAATPPRMIVPLWRRTAMRVAAVLIPAAMLAGGYFWYNSTQSKEDVPSIVATTGTDQTPFTPTQTVSSEQIGIRKVVLADGTEVTLNRNSTLAYNDSREARLSGEAWFKVAKDADHPFIIHSEKLTVTVLGTEFNFNTSNHSAQCTLSLYEGIVKLEHANGSHHLDEACCEFILDHATGLTEVRKFDPSTDRPEWLAIHTETRIMTLDDIFHAIASAYDVQFDGVQTIDLTQVYSFRIASGQSLRQTLSSLQMAGAVFNYTINEGTVQLSPKQ